MSLTIWQEFRQGLVRHKLWNKKKEDFNLWDYMRMFWMMGKFLVGWPIYEIGASKVGVMA